MKESLRLALQPSVVKRALKYAVIVGIVLITINHSDALLNGETNRFRLDPGQSYVSAETRATDPAFWNPPKPAPRRP